MSTAAIVVMLIGILIIWGGLTASVVVAVRRTRADAEPGPPPPSN